MNFTINPIMTLLIHLTVEPAKNHSACVVPQKI